MWLNITIIGVLVCILFTGKLIKTSIFVERFALLDKKEICEVVDLLPTSVLGAKICHELHVAVYCYQQHRSNNGATYTFAAISDHVVLYEVSYTIRVLFFLQTLRRYFDGKKCFKLDINKSGLRSVFALHPSIVAYNMVPLCNMKRVLYQFYLHLPKAFWYIMSA